MVTCSSGTSFRVVVVTLLVVPALIFWLWLMKEAIRTAYQCPEECWCSVNGISVDCTNASLKNIPLELHNEIRHLTLDHNNIPILRTEDFINSGLIELELLSLEYSGIFTVEPGAFRGLSKLQDLQLYGNNITIIQPDVFSYLPNLERLYLGDNNIKSLYSTIFVNLNNLLHLSLEENEITYIDSDVFIGLNNLHSLCLSGNKITHLQLNVFKYMPNLGRLNLKNNKKLVIPTERPFLNLPNLNILLLSGCNIKRLSSKTFDLSPDLYYIDLANNSISTLELNILRSLPQLKTLKLNGNPLDCDCRLREVWQWCQDHEIQVGVENNVPRCSRPTEVSGLWWGVLGKAQCSRERIEFEGDYQSVIHEYIPSSPKYEEHIKFITYVESSVYGVLFLIGAAGNITLLIVIGCNKRMRTIPNAYIFNLAVGDLLSLTINLPILHATKLSSQWMLGEFMCKLITFSHYLSIGVTAFSVSVLSMQRYYTTSGSANLSTKRATLITISSVWIIAFGCSLPSVFSFTVKGEGYCSPFFGLEYFRLVTTFYLLVFCTIPLCIIVCMYIMTARQLVLHAQQTEEDSRSYRTLAKIVIGLSIVFFLSYVPYHVLWTIFVWIIIESVSIIEYVRFISLCLLVLNSCLNPIALCCASVTFRKLFKYYLFCCRKSTIAAGEESDLSEKKEKSVRYKKDIVTEAAIL